jgi:hypothetical protein
MGPQCSNSTSCSEAGSGRSGLAVPMQTKRQARQQQETMTWHQPVLTQYQRHSTPSGLQLGKPSGLHPESESQTPANINTLSSQLLLSTLPSDTRPGIQLLYASSWTATARPEGSSLPAQAASHSAAVAVLHAIEGPPAQQSTAHQHKHNQLRLFDPTSCSMQSVFWCLHPACPAADAPAQHP